MTTVAIDFPFLGVNKNGKLSEQPPGTSRDMLNCWPIDATTGRMRGGVRPGTSSYFSGEMAGRGNKIQAFHSLPFQARHVAYSAATIPDELWAASLAGNPTISCIAKGLYDDFFAIQGNTILVHYSRYGIALGSVVIENANADMQINALHVADDGAIYVGTTTWVSNFASVASYRSIWKYVLAPNNRDMELAWQITPGTQHTTAGLFVVGDFLWSLETSHTSSTVADSELVRYSGINTSAGPLTGDRLPVETITGTILNNLDSLWGSSTNVYGHDFHVRTRGETSFYCALGSVRDASAGRWAQIKLRGQPGGTSTANYCFMNDESSAASSFRGGGVGFSIRVDNTGNVHSIGRRNPNDRDAALSATSGNWLRKLVDTGTAWSETQGWVRTTTADLGGAANAPGFGYARCDLDNFSNFIAPTCLSNSAVDAAKVVRTTGTLFTSIRHQEYILGVPTNTNNDCRAVAVPTTHPEYQPDDYKVTDTVFVAGSNVVTLTSESTGAVIHGYDILEETADPNVSSRAVARLGVAAGGIYRFTTAGTQVPTNSTGRTPVLSSTARFIQAADCKGEVFFTDGQNYCVYRPMPGDATNPYGEIVEWRATSLGVIPPRARLICRWRSRIVLAHTADSPHFWAMSAFDDPYDWDTDPPEVLETQAVSGDSLPAAGDTPDLIHALIPWNDDLLFMLCSRSILRFDGDPMSGGRLSVVSDEIGGAFGSPWCKDPEGRVYFFGSKGGIYVMGPTGDLTWLTRDTIEKDLADVDLSVNRVELTWNSRDNGLHVWILPYGVGEIHLRHYFWSQRTGGWFPVEMGTASYTDIQPTAVHVIDGDTAIERVMLIGTENGQVLKWDPNASLDSDQPIYRRVLIGPLAGPDGSHEARWKRPTVVLAKELGGCNVKFFASDTPETPVMPRSGVRVGSGLNARLPIQCRGSYCWVELSSASRVGAQALGERWALESMSIEAIVAGRAHARSQ